MKNRAINALIEMGMPADLKGFKYIVDMMVLYQDEDERFAGVISNYITIAQKRKTTASKVERAIRHAFSIVLTKGDLKAVEKYLSLQQTTNGNLLHVLYIRLTQEVEV